MLKASRVQKAYDRVLVYPILSFLCEFGIKPRHISAMGLAAGAGAGVSFALDPFWGDG